MSDAAVQLADDYWRYHRKTAQLWNIDRGDVDQIAHWEDLSSGGVADRVARLVSFGQRADELGRTELDDRARALIAAVAFSARANASLLPYARDVTLVAGAFNIATFLTVLVPGYALTTREHGRGYIAKLRSMPSFIDGWIDGLGEGIGEGRCATARGIASAVAELDAILGSDPASDPLVRQSAPTEMSEPEAERWRAEIVDCVDHSVRPALVRLRHMLTESALPVARSDDQPGICHSAGGDVDYQALLRAATSTDSTAEQVHEIGRVSVVATDIGPMAYYTAPSPDGTRSGTLFFNTSDPTMWTRFGLEASTFHESVPGHHLQLALAQELDLHPVLGELEVTSYSEGWGLYAERLADEMSLYSGPLQQLGMLSLDSLRAARLVVDTGIHAMGWTRDEATAFLMSCTSLVRANAEREIDRYIADPGQATSYMIGRLEIERLRVHAAARLGDRFSLREFHATVLGNGMTPLTELARCIETWINA